MANPVMRVNRALRARPDLPPGTVLDSDDETMWVRDGRRCWVWCPGCDGAHALAVVGEDGSRPEGPTWEWDGNTTAPTFSPSLLVHAAGDHPRCHSFIRAGSWQFLGDCGHDLAGQTVPLPPLPDWLAGE